ncbi:hypothetical protein [Candidatus Uabimicrobium sp. HlEnr_7]|uniref:hypothetical protein n=1 Tax=Candidatus Uabimicrobium helgolandensis TaxID=3095367 RepID=UPI0035575B91
MHIRLMCLIIFCILFLGCDETKNTATDYSKTMIKTLDAAQKIKYTTSIQQLIRMYKIENSKWPSKLDDLKEIPELPEGWVWVYDNKAGKVDIAKK